MERININNYEEFALDYIEGSMTKDEEKLFEDFLDEHPDVAKEIYNLKSYMPVIEHNGEVYTDKNILYKRKAGFRKIVWTSAAAAAIVTGFILSLVFQTSEAESENLHKEPVKLAAYFNKNEKKSTIVSNQEPIPNTQVVSKKTESVEIARQSDEKV